MKRKPAIQLLILLFFVMIAHQYQSCKKIDLKRVVLVTTGQADNITYQSATLNGTMVDAGEEGEIVEYGFVYNSDSDSVLSRVIIQGTASSGAISAFVEGISSNTTYYFSSYATAKDGQITYGNVSSFKTPLDPDATVPAVNTISVMDTSAYSAKIKGEVTDDGGATVIHRGFCISTEPNPNVDDLCSENGEGVGEFTNTFSALTPETEYYVRAYATNELGTAYGEQLTFITHEGGGTITEWLFYDDSENFDGIGLTDGGSFDVAIRFTPEQLAPFDGFMITRIKFFPKLGAPVEYLLEVLTGESPTIDDLVYEQLVESPQIDEWNDVALDEPYIIDASEELWVGYFVNNQQPNTYPAGVDNGAAVVGFGDMISTDNLESWVTLSEAGIDANWNIQVLVSNEAGVEVPLLRNLQSSSRRNPLQNQESKITSSKQANH